MAKKTGLGRGLGSLISGGISTPTPNKNVQAKKKTAKKVSRKTAKKAVKKKAARKPAPPKKAESVEESRQTAVGLFELPISRIIPSSHQPRRDFNEESLEELAESIRSEGLLQPVVVRPHGDKYELIAGERRWRACQKLKLKLIPARVMEASESSSAVLSLIENLQREDLNPIEESMGYASLMRDFDLTQEQVAERVGRSRAAVANSLRLLQLAREIQAYLTKGLISVGHAKVLLGVEDADNRLLLARQAIERGWSVRDLERQVERLKSHAGVRPKARANMPAEEVRAIEDLQNQLSSTFSTRVLLKHTPKKGRIIIEYHGNDDLQRIIEQMGMR
jgi:ParB family chromosome partitioning protein